MTEDYRLATFENKAYYYEVWHIERKVFLYERIKL